RCRRPSFWDRSLRPGRGLISCALALGNGSLALGNGSLVLGNGSLVLGSGSLILGSGNFALGGGRGGSFTGPRFRRRRLRGTLRWEARSRVEECVLHPLYVGNALQALGDGGGGEVRAHNDLHALVKGLVGIRQGIGPVGGH